LGKGCDLILVTGAHGLLGTQIIEILKADPNFAEEKLLIPNRNELDLLDEKKVIEFFRVNKPNLVFHLAARVMGLQGNLEHQTESFIENMTINNSIFKASIKYPPEKFFFAGTAASYAHPYAHIPLSEQDFLLGDVHESEFGYAWAKRTSYPWLKILRDELGVKSCYGILTNLFGPNDRFKGAQTHVIPALIQRAHESKSFGIEQLDIWGFPSVSRDFLYSPKAARIITDIMKSGKEFPLLVNIGSGVETSMDTVARIIANKFGIRKIKWQHQKPTGVQKRYLDVSVLRNMEINISIDIEEELNETIDWYLSNLESIR